MAPPASQRTSASLKKAPPACNLNCLALASCLGMSEEGAGRGAQRSVLAVATLLAVALVVAAAVALVVATPAAAAAATAATTPAAAAAE